MFPSKEEEETAAAAAAVDVAKEWPKVESGRVKLILPPKYSDPYDADDDDCCPTTTTTKEKYFKLDYDYERQLLLVVSSSSSDDNDDNHDDEILDVINIQDVIGASIIIKKDNSSNESPSLSRTCSRSSDTASCSDHDDNANNNSSNEQPPDIIPTNIDSQQGSEVKKEFLEIYVYPRKDLSKEEGKLQSMIRSCGFGRTNNSNNNKNKVYMLEEMETSKKKIKDPSKLGSRYACHRKFEIASSSSSSSSKENTTDITTIVQAIRKLASPSSSLSSSKKNLLIIVNPFSGQKLGKEIYETKLRPMLQQGGYNHEVFYTQYAGHAQEQMAKKEKNNNHSISSSNGNKKNDDAGKGNCIQKDITEYDGIVAVGGDGILHEIFQGLKLRPDFNNKAMLSKLKIGHVGAGTSNGYSKSLTYACQEHDKAIDYCFQVAKGNTCKMDISKYQTLHNEYYSFLSYSWGIIADIDIESEILRFIGSIRMDIWGVWKVLQFRTYKAKFSYLPAGGEKASKDLDDDVDFMKEMPPLTEPLPPTISSSSSSTSKEEDDDGDDSTKKWVTEESEFLIFWASHVTHAAENTFHSPPTKLPAEGVFTIFIVRNNVSRLRLALILLAMETGQHVGMEGVEFVKCTAFRLEPISSGSFNDLDGEVIESGPIQGQVLPAAVEVFSNLHNR